MSKKAESRLAQAGQRFHGALTKMRDAGGMMSAARATVRLIRREGLRGAARRIGGVSQEAGRYPKWIGAYDSPDDAALSTFRRQLEEGGIDTLISVVVPVFNTPERYLREMIESVLRQAYPHWELCIADDASTAPHVRAVLCEYALRDARIRIIYRAVNGHISEASNSALELARGPFVALLDHDDVLPPHALGVVAKYIHAHPAARLFYSDEDKLSEEGHRHTPHFKPDWDPELILQHNAFSHLGVYETQLMRDVGGFRQGLEGSQDHDLLLRCVRLAGDAAVVHIPHVLYHWRTIEGSTAVSVEEKPYAVMATVRAISDHLRETDTNATVVAPQAEFPFVRIDYGLPAVPPTVHILIAHGGDMDALRRCVTSIVSRTRYANRRLSIVAGVACGLNADTQEALTQLVASLKCASIVESIDDIVNRVDDAYICFVDERVEVTDPSWLHELMKLACRENVGVVGASLWQPDENLYAGGLVLVSQDGGVPIHAGITRRGAGYFGRAMLTQTVSAVSLSCAVISRSDFIAAGGFDRTSNENFSRDVSLCRRVAQRGLRNVFVPRAGVTIHAHLAARGHGPAFERSPAELANDRGYNPNLALGGPASGATFGLAFPPRIGRFE
ncbi:glycosyltransferase [Caballeronia concitans]|uniref:Glycosyl transferase family protein n=1 Tax=Caballeronia concitans TaxID=1777133 RepID=A0A658QZL0_9BURK|nr:glycosyltransferase [Caballeronia concitans]SAL34901.1 glycosyl transferase family protein [Caballeronia concitans]